MIRLLSAHTVNRIAAGEVAAGNWRLTTED
jgi:DNA mismatch repair ATPase MutL